MKINRFALYVSVLLVGMASCNVGCGGKTDSDGDDKPKITEQSNLPKPDFSLASFTLVEEYKKDREAARKKYTDKLVEVYGMVVSNGRTSDSSFLVLEGPEGGFVNVRCFTTDARPWTRATPGQVATLRGTLADFSGGPRLTGCILTDVKGDPAPEVSATQLAKDRAAAATKKYQDKYLVVSGEVVKKESNAAGAVSVWLKADDKLKVRCVFPALMNTADTGAIKVGQTIRVLGEFSSLFASGEDELGLGHCCLMEPPK